MKNTDTSELLRENIAHALSGLDADTWAYALGEYRRMLGEPFPRPQVADRSSVADAFRQADKVVAILPGLQAEAPTDAEVAKFLSFWTREKARTISASFEVAVDLLNRLRARTSQAEAQAPAVTQKREREGHKYADHDGTSNCAHGCGAWMGPFRSGAPNGINPFGECPKAPLLQTPAQAEAQAPTTAAPVLTEPPHIKARRETDLTAARLQYAAYRKTQESAKRSSEDYTAWCVGAASISMNIAEIFMAEVTRLTSASVGEPAPAPTTWRPLISELREVIEDAKERFNRDGKDGDQISDQVGYIASALLGFISTNLQPAKGYTP